MSSLSLRVARLAPIPFNLPWRTFPMARALTFFLISAIHFSMLTYTIQAEAGWLPPIEAEIKNGKVTEYGDKGDIIRLYLTGHREKRSYGLDFDGDGEINVEEKIVGDSGKIEFPLPKDDKGKVKKGVPVGSGSSTPRDITDAYQQTKKNNAGEISELHISAFYPSGSDFQLIGFTNHVADNIGLGIEVFIPDLFADTNGDGSLNDGDLLYSIVNLVDFLPAAVNFSLGDTFNIVNGTSPLLPGMMFGTAPIEVDADSPSGYSNPSPWTGPGVALTKHGIVAVSEPPLFLVFMSFVAYFFARTQRSQMTVKSLSGKT